MLLDKGREARYFESFQFSLLFLTEQRQHIHLSNIKTSKSSSVLSIYTLNLCAVSALTSHHKTLYKSELFIYFVKLRLITLNFANRLHALMNSKVRKFCCYSISFIHAIGILWINTTTAEELSIACRLLDYFVLDFYK